MTIIPERGINFNSNKAFLDSSLRRDLLAKNELRLGEAKQIVFRNYIPDTGLKRHGEIGAWLLAFVRCIIRNMLELSKRCWQVFLLLFALFLLGGLQVFYYLDEYTYQGVIIAILLILAVIYLIIGIAALVYDFKDARRKDREPKAAKVHEVLKESFKNVHPEWRMNRLR